MTVKPDKHGWRPIETAPKDEGKVILVVSCGDAYAAEWMPDWYGDKTKACWIHAYNDEEYGFDLDPTHWQPLPEPPEEKNI